MKLLDFSYGTKYFDTVTRRNVTIRRVEQYSLNEHYPVETKSSLKYWKVQKGARVNAQFIRISDMYCKRYGAIWSRKIFFSDNWLIEAKFSINGSESIGGDGMAFWFTMMPNRNGRLFGSSHNFTGLSVFLNSMSSQENKETIGILMNNGTNTPTPICSSFRKFRNSVRPNVLQISYLDKELSVTLTTDAGNEILCSKVKNIILPKSGYFGISASNGLRSDDEHDLYSFFVYNRSDDEDLMLLDELTAEKSLIIYIATILGISIVLTIFVSNFMYLLGPQLEMEKECGTT
ncbi:hypothetical protein ACOME3_007919 [Neoechinorhynchus agilis]